MTLWKAKIFDNCKSSIFTQNHRYLHKNHQYLHKNHQYYTKIIIIYTKSSIFTQRIINIYTKIINITQKSSVLHKNHNYLHKIIIISTKSSIFTQKVINIYTKNHQYLNIKSTKFTQNHQFLQKTLRIGLITFEILSLVAIRIVFPKFVNSKRSVEVTNITQKPSASFFRLEEYRSQFTEV